MKINIVYSLKSKVLTFASKELESYIHKMLPNTDTTTISSYHSCMLSASPPCIRKYYRGEFVKNFCSVERRKIVVFCLYFIDFVSFLDLRNFISFLQQKRELQND